MSTEAGFSSMAFPSLRDADQDRSGQLARARGHAAGYAEGLRAAAAAVNDRVARLDAEHAAAVRHGEARIDRAVELLRAAVQALNLRSVPVLREADRTLAATAIDLAEAILGSELGQEETSARRALERALDHSDAAEVHTVRMHPADLAILDEATRSLTGVAFAADPSLARGDAITEFPVGWLDARIGTALARAKTALLGANP